MKPVDAFIIISGFMCASTYSYAYSWEILQDKKIPLSEQKHPFIRAFVGLVPIISFIYGILWFFLAPPGLAPFALIFLAIISHKFFSNVAHSHVLSETSNNMGLLLRPIITTLFVSIGYHLIKGIISPQN